MDLWTVFFTGLTIGGLTCLVVQGGLLASTVAAREGEDLARGVQRNHTVWPTISFLTTKLLSYIVLGFLLGWFGSALQISDTSRIIIQSLAGLYMMTIALNLLNVHPLFRYVVIQPPKFATKMIKDTSKGKDLFAPALLGILTIFIPCGTTLAMEALAISSGSPILGAAIMGVFTVGTSPLFFGLGYVTIFLGDTFKRKFLKIAALLVFYLGITSVNGALVLAGSPVNLQSLGSLIPIEIDLSGGVVEAGEKVRIIDGVQVADINIYPTSYNPNYLQVKLGIPLRLNLLPMGGYGCTSAFAIPQLGIRRNLTLGRVEVVEFTPHQKGRLIWTCSMGMYSGTMEVI